MANWCSNWVNVSGDPKSVEAFMNDIKELNEESIKNECGVSPLNPPEDGKYMFELYIDNDDAFSFSTKWAPAFDSLRFLAQKHRVIVTNRYEEFGCGIYGECQFDGIECSETDTYLEDDEIDSVVEVDEDNSIWEFEGQQSDCREDLLSIVLERKINGEL
jgi:hypothetical protein